MEQIYNVLYQKSDEFGSIAKKVNESSRNRRTHANEAIKYINLSLDICEELLREITSVQKADTMLRDQNNIVNSECKIIESNLKHQKQILAKLNKLKAVPADIEKQIIAKIDYLNNSLKEAFHNVQIIIKANNEIILYGDRLLALKQFQKEQIGKLKVLTEKSLDDAEKAIAGSSSNLNRGLEMVEKFKNVQTLIEENNVTELNRLAEEANMGSKIAQKVNISSTSQLEYAQKVNQFTKELHKDTITIKELVVKKHHMFMDNLQIITLLTVILDLKLKKYLDVENIVKNIEHTEDTRDMINDLHAYVKIACDDIRAIGVLNYDMADTSHLYNEIEDKTVKTSKLELEYFDNIKKEVEDMTTATAYPIEGSNENITNGKILETKIKELIKKIKG